MAKKKPEKSLSTEGSTTYSTRLADDQKELLEQAAALTGVSASRFIRDATLRAALDVVNAAPPNDRAIQATMARIADILLNQPYKLVKQNYAGVPFTKKGLGSRQSIDLQVNRSDVLEESEEPVSLILESISHDDIKNLESIARSCPVTFAQSMVKAILGVTEPLPTFAPKADPDRHLND